MKDLKGQLHCQSCGRTDEEAVGWAARREMDGYTACCNEIAVVSDEQVYNTYKGTYSVRPAPCDPTVCYHE